jgi:transcription initiation factor TFIIB
MSDEIDIWNIMDVLKEGLNIKKNSIEGVCSCGSTNILVEDTMQICADCSCIIGKVIDNTAEWRYYGNSDNKNIDPSRCGLPTNNLLPKSSLGSMIGCNRKDNIDIRRIRMYQMWNSMPYDERTLWNVFDKLNITALSNGIPQKIIDDAKVLYKKASEKKISRGDNKDGLIASCLYNSCLINNIPRSSKEIAKMFEIDPIVLNKGNSRFQTLLQINVVSSSANEFISRYCSQLNMKINDIEICKNLTYFLENNEIISDNAPTSSCASILYYYSQKKELGYTKKQIADICNVSEVTVIKGYKMINKYNNFIEKNINI